MNNKKKLIIWAVILIALAFLVWIYIKSKKKNETTSTAESAAPGVDPFPLKFGKTGKEVKQAQMAAKLKLLKSDGINNSFPKYGCDGKWGNETTEWMTKAFKRDNISKDFFDKTLMGNINVSAF